MSLVSIYFTVYLFYCFFYKSKKEFIISMVTLLAIFSIFINIGYFINVGSISLTIEDVISSKLNKKSTLVGIYLIMFIIIGVLKTYIYPYNEVVLTPGKGTGLMYGVGQSYSLPKVSAYSIRYLIRIILIVIICLGLKKNLVKQDYDKVFNKIINFGKFYYFIIAVEFISKNLLNSKIYIEIINFLFNVNIHTIKRGTLYALTGLKYEPAQFAEGLWLFGLIISLYYFDTKKKNIMFLFNTIFLLISGSLKGLFFLICLVIIYLIVNKPNKNTKVFMVIGTLIIFIPSILIIDINYYLERITNIIDIVFNYDRYSIKYNSENIRMMTVLEAFNIFKSRPLFGIGIGTTYAFGAIPSVLATIGIIGLILWYKFITLITELHVDLKVFIILFLSLCIYIGNGSISIMYNIGIILVFILLSNLKNNVNRVKIDKENI